jgi:hypothetical protein
MFPRQRALRTDLKETTTPLLLTGRCLSTDPTKERITSLLGLCLVTDPNPKENANAAKQDTYIHESIADTFDFI